ncbi:MAG: sigma-54-dependent Fis family transcriptional regulator, partial [Nitrospirae bacterium]
MVMGVEDIEIMVIDDEPAMLRVIKKTLEQEGFSVSAFSDARDALKKLKEHNPFLIITDLMMPQMDGFSFIERAKGLNNEVMIIVITAYSSIETAVKAMKAGAYDFIPKPFDPDHLVLVVKRAVENRLLRLENIGLRERLEGRDFLDDIIGLSETIQSIKDTVRKIRNTDANVLITGESGTGKELVARAIHFGSRRKDAPFLPINCGALPEELLESELFGYKRGAFTGATSDKKGLLEIAHGGTVFLDEVESISLKIQVKLLRFLQDRTFIPLGDNTAREVDIRVIAATNEDLNEAIREGRFRKDLYYRLNVIPINIPPLRERREDIPLLVRHFINRFNHREGRQIRGISDEAMKALTGYNWDGNVRELENTLERVMILSEGPVIGFDDLPEEIRNYDGK